ncbi:hypothetical protein FQ154_18640 [Paeniglutamicibacter gangotriensis]|uniref:Lipoprotein n=1 Tax=Paeniglutamicibacter gangotriensis TaxID=254787 RepID=A0A5B0E5Y1_9MICC|nr:hypothetical protein [Paeniglutamicibacter gangotriensis]KAA0973321.1 hypothetical protein FQ154_18640 [Paeniglutamicibacter gangotriensis]
MMKKPVLITAAALSLLLTGCNTAGGTSPTETATASASPSASGIPSASAEPSAEVPVFEPVTTKPGPDDVSVNAAFEALEGATAVYNKQAHAQDDTTGDLAKYTTADQFAEDSGLLRDGKKDNIMVEGDVKVEKLSGYSTEVIEDGKKLKDHFVYLEICQDVSEVEVTLGNGKKGEKPELTRAVMEVQAKYSTDLERWLVGKSEFKDGGVPC